MTTPPQPADGDFLDELDAELPGWENAQWDRAIALLRGFMAENGHTRVPQRYKVHGFPLGRWVSKRREDRKAGRLSPERIAELDARGFIWDALADDWRRGIGYLRAYVAANGDARVPYGHEVDGFDLGTWVGSRRKDRKAGQLSPERIAELDTLGFLWDPFDDDWRRGIGHLRAYVAANGDARVPRGHEVDGFDLGNWVRSRRRNRKAGRLSPERIAELDALGFIWDALADDWQRGIGYLGAYVAENGDARVPQRHRIDGFRLGAWVSERRSDRRAGRLSPDRIAELDALGFIWEPLDDDWRRGIGYLNAFMSQNGDAPVQRNYTVEGFNLGSWVSNRRDERKHDRLSADRIAELDTLGFVWDVPADAWRRAAEALRAYVAANGDARVPVRYTADDGFGLGSWVRERRIARRDGVLSADRIAELDTLGFIWDPLEDDWRRGIGYLRDYVTGNGDARVQRGHRVDGLDLGGWVGKRRNDRKNGRLSRERIAELDNLGFVWDARADDWRRGVGYLRAYVGENLHARVPQRHGVDGFPLGAWVAKRRNDRKAERLSAARIAELDALGFIWEPGRGKRPGVEEQS